MKENKKRIIFWFIVFLIFVSCSIYGKKLFNDGYGKYGEYKKILEPIMYEFNTLPDINKLTDIKTRVTKNTLVVSYVNSSNKKEKFVYEYGTKDNIRYITSKDNDKSNNWTIVMLNMINAVYHINKGTGSIYEKYDFSTFEKTTLEEGVIYNPDLRTVTINIDANIANNIEGKYASLKDDKYVKEEDLADLLAKLEQDHKFRIQIDDIKMYIKDDKNQYDIYIAYTDDNIQRVYKSLEAAIKILKPDIYLGLLDEEGNLKFEENSKDYTILTNAVFSEPDIFNVEDKLINLTLYKN